MNNQNSAQKKSEASVTATLGIAGTGTVTEMPKQNREINYSREQLAAYLESQLTGKSVMGKPFGQSISETNFTEEDRKAIQEARRMHRLTVSVGAAKAALLHEIKNPKWKMVGFRENAKGDKRGMRFVNPTVLA